MNLDIKKCHNNQGIVMFLRLPRKKWYPKDGNRSEGSTKQDELKLTAVHH